MKEKGLLRYMRNSLFAGDYVFVLNYLFKLGSFYTNDV